MISPVINGTFSDGKTSSVVDCQLAYDSEGQISLSGDVEKHCAFSDLRISPRVGNTARYIEFEDGSVFETRDNDAVDTLLASLSDSRFHNIAHRLESSKRLVFVTLIVILLFSWIFIQFGIPHFSRQIAFMFSPEQTRYLGKDVLATMDEHLLEASTLSEAKQTYLRSVFDEIAESVDRPDLTIVFRHSKTIGANAFALPDGTIVFIDELIDLSSNIDEVISIMLHEIGHVQNRHSLRRAIQGFSLAIFVAVVTGDVSTSSTIITGLPVLLVESGYSREMETEADTYSLQYMLQHDIDPAHFANIMTRIEHTRLPEYRSCVDDGEPANVCMDRILEQGSPLQEDDSAITGYFASHPGTEERIARFRQYAIQ